MTERATLRENRDIEDTRYLRKLLFDCDWNVVRAASVAGIHRSTFYALMYRLGILQKYQPADAFARQLRKPLRERANGR